MAQLKNVSADFEQNFTARRIKKQKENFCIH